MILQVVHMNDKILENVLGQKNPCLHIHNNNKQSLAPAPVVLRPDNTMHKMSRYPVDKC